MDYSEMLYGEHELIERLFSILKQRIPIMRSNGRLDQQLIEIFSDFFITYIDIAHHGKEENIFFPLLKKRGLSEDDQKAIDSLIDEHRLGRNYVEMIMEANNNYKQGNIASYEKVLDLLTKVIDIYENHIKKEDENYFPKFSSYLSDEDKDNLIQQFLRFNIELIDVRYKKLFDLIEGKEL